MVEHRRSRRPARQTRARLDQRLDYLVGVAPLGRPCFVEDARTSWEPSVCKNASASDGIGTRRAVDAALMQARAEAIQMVQILATPAGARWSQAGARVVGDTGTVEQGHVEITTEFFQRMGRRAHRRQFARGPSRTRSKASTLADVHGCSCLPAQPSRGKGHRRCDAKRRWRGCPARSMAWWSR